ncbi:MAG: BolA/IbaG family iron-sulfur metabolism protein [Candidatus Omnitrophica bacterium]|nr:BolA/IbaG family iron-sulfur metabolism protein [Candidatus Omnitrophota bacterium]
MTLDQIKRIIEEHVPDSQAIVLDPYNDGEHLQALVISPEFEGKMLVKQHQMVMKPLKEAFATTVHALGLKTFTPSEWEKVRQEFGY